MVKWNGNVIAIRGYRLKAVSHLKENIFLDRLEPTGIKFNSVLGRIDDSRDHSVLLNRW